MSILSVHASERACVFVCAHLFEWRGEHSVCAHLWIPEVRCRVSPSITACLPIQPAWQVSGLQELTCLLSRPGVYRWVLLYPHPAEVLGSNSAPDVYIVRTVLTEPSSQFPKFYFLIIIAIAINPIVINLFFSPFLSSPLSCFPSFLLLPHTQK